MDANGARELERRIQEQEDWRRADAVQQGEQPSRDPDAADLEEIRDGVRRYGTETREEVVDGRSVTVTHRLCKRLREGRWETVYELEQSPRTADLS
jgi:DNA-nicking Smr family endonuclease